MSGMIGGYGTGGNLFKMSGMIQFTRGYRIAEDLFKVSGIWGSWHSRGPVQNEWHYWGLWHKRGSVQNVWHDLGLWHSRGSVMAWQRIFSK